MESSSAPRVRCFLAITPPAGVLDAVERHVHVIRKQVRGGLVSWERRHKWHVTMQFIGDVHADRLPDLRDAVSLATASRQPFSASAIGIGVFPPANRPRVLWIGVRSAAEGLLDLHRVLHSCAQSFAGHPLDSRFHPHLTIARIRDNTIAASRALRSFLVENEPEFGSWSVRAVELWRSQLSSSGSAYELLGAFPLDG